MVSEKQGVEFAYYFYFILQIRKGTRYLYLLTLSRWFQRSQQIKSEIDFSGINLTTFRFNLERSEFN
jgi:hypothetical protein